MKKNKSNKIIILFIFIVVHAGNNFCQNFNTESIDANQKEKTIGKICRILKENYVFPETAKKMEEFLKSQLSLNAYDKITDTRKFAEALTIDVQSISNDKHLRINYNPDLAGKLKENDNTGPSPEQEKQLLEKMKSENFGFKKTECLSGNIGFVDFRYFGDSKYISETVSSVMAFLSNTDAIIFDVRFNGGGSPDGIRLICSYLFGNTPVHLNDLYFRPDDKTEEFWTLRKVDGKRMPDIPVYILTSSYTFSGAEEFTYNLKNLKRAVIIGETTGGGAHPGGTMAIDNKFVIFVPVGRAINPVTNTNWEGTGVTPDIPVPSENALETAHVLALKKLAENSKQQKDKEYYIWIAESIESSINAPVIDDKILQNYAGTYGDRKIFYTNGSLYYQRGKRQKMHMIYMGNDTFMFKDFDFFRLRIDKDTEGNVTGLTGLYNTGETDNSPITK